MCSITYQQNFKNGLGPNLTKMKNFKVKLGNWCEFGASIWLITWLALPQWLQSPYEVSRKKDEPLVMALSEMQLTISLKFTSGFLISLWLLLNSTLKSHILVKHDVLSPVSIRCSSAGTHAEQFASFVRPTGGNWLGRNRLHSREKSPGHAIHWTLD